MSTTALKRIDSAHTPSTAPSLPLLLTSDPVMAGASRLFTGPELTRIAPGTYVPAQEWKEARPGLRHLTLIRAALAKTRGDLVLLGASAAVWLGLPLVKTHRAGHLSRSPTEIPLGYAKNARLGV